jgi:pimeloyl-ACP methyl ester carboxylesterase
MPLELNVQYFAGNSANIPLIVLHGLFGSTANWRTLCKRYAVHRDVYALDLRNHGQSPHHPRMSIEDMAGDVLAFLDRQQLTSCVLLGHSMGGKVAMQLALEHPERVERLIVADIAPKHYPPRHNEVFAAIELIDRTRITHRNQADKLIEDVLPDQATRLFLLTNLARDDDGEYQWRIDVQAIRDNYKTISDAPPAVHSGKQFNKPALFVRGDKSFYIQPEDGNLITSLFPKAAMEEIPDAGHWVHAEQPEAFFRITQRFLDQ